MVIPILEWLERERERERREERERVFVSIIAMKFWGLG